MASEWDFDFIHFTLVIGVATFFLFFVKIFRTLLKDTHIPIRDASKAHNWQTIPYDYQPSVCNICESLLINTNGFYCDCCGVCSDSNCLKKANRKLKCKEVSVDPKENLEHRWVKGNLPVGCSCSFCGEDCSLEPGLTDFRCIWCLTYVHSSCQKSVPQFCDFGQFRSFIVPPNHLILNYKRAHVGRKLRLKAVSDPLWPDWRPVFVVGNRKSGNYSGNEILSGFRGLLNPAQVVDLCERPPTSLQDWFNLLPPSAKPIVLVAGGDGTVSSVLSTIRKSKLKCIPVVAIVPLGTGNDLSRVLGWGKEEQKPFSAQKVLEELKRAEEVSLDRWTVDFSPVKHLGLRLSRRQMYMYNYLSVGVDAQVTLDFHRTRKSKFFIFSSRIINKFLYLIFGTQQVMERGCRNLEQRLELYMDGKLVELPEIESIVILNIPSWGAGVLLWTIGASDAEEPMPEQSFSDRKVEVLAIYSSFHIAQLQVGLSQPHRLGQASKVKIKLKNKLPIQIDGEPWLQNPSEILINHLDQVQVLQLPSS